MSPTSCPTIFLFSHNTSTQKLPQVSCESLYSQALIHAVHLPGPPSYLFSWLVPLQSSCLKDLTTLFKMFPSYLSPAIHQHSTHNYSLLLWGFFKYFFSYLLTVFPPNPAPLSPHGKSQESRTMCFLHHCTCSIHFNAWVKWKKKWMKWKAKHARRFLGSLLYSKLWL